jgi:hypothetical protein
MGGSSIVDHNFRYGGMDGCPNRFNKSEIEQMAGNDC